MGETWKIFRRGTWQKSEINQKWSIKHERRAQKFILPHWRTSVIWKMLNWRQSTKSTKVELYSAVILWKTIQNLTQYSLNKDHQHHKGQEPKVMHIISRLPGCDGQAADAVSAYTQVKMEDAPKWLKIPKRMSRHLDSSNTTQMAKIMVQYGRPSRSSWAKSVRSSFCRTVLGKAIWENPIETWLGENSKLGMSLCSSWRRIILVCVCGWHKLAGKKQNINPMWKLLNKEVDFGAPTSSLDHVYLGCTQRQCEISNDIVDNYRTMFESRISAVRAEKLPFSENLRISSFSCDMEGHAKKCVDLSWVSKQDDSTALQSIHSMHRWPPLQGRRSEFRGRIVKSVLSNCFKMFILGTNCKTWYSMVSEQTCKIHHIMDQSLWLTPESIDFLHSSCMWIQTILLCG